MLVVLTRSQIHGEIRAPPSKSVAQRLFLASVLAMPGSAKIGNVLLSEDVRASLRFAEALGATAKIYEDKEIVTLEVPEEKRPRVSVVNLGDSGTAYRIALGIAATLDIEMILECGRTLRRRPIGELVNALHRLGAKIRYLEREGFPPVAVRGPIRGGKVEISGNVSSQFISALIYAGVGSSDGLEIRVRPPVVSKPYIDLTIRVLRRLRADVELEDLEDDGLVIYAYPSEMKLTDIDIPGDYALSAFIMAIAAVAGDKVVIRGFDKALNPVDYEVVDILKEMDVRVHALGDIVYVEETPEISPVDISLKDNPDLVMPIAAVAAFASGVSTIRDVRHLVYKESNRLEEIRRCLTEFKINVEVDEHEGVLKIHGIRQTSPARIELPDDHRIGMMCSVIGLATEGRTVLSKAECVRKSWPSYWNELKRLGASIEIREEHPALI